MGSVDVGGEVLGAVAIASDAGERISDVMMRRHPGLDRQQVAEFAREEVWAVLQDIGLICNARAQVLGGGFGR